MNILYLTNHLNVGGITSYVLTLAKGLRLKGHNTYVASSGGKLLPRFIQEGIVYIPIPIRTKSEISPKILISTFKLLGFLKQYRIDIVHSNSRTTQVLGCLISDFTDALHISTCHGFFKRRISRRVFPCWGRRIIAISEAVKEHLIKDFGAREEIISLIHHGVDVEKFKMDKKERLGSDNGPVIGIIARLSEEKGHTYLIEAMPEVINRFPKAQLLIVGEGRMKQRLVDLSKALKLENNVRFLPSVIDMQEIFGITDIFVLPSLKEGLGLSLMEAMASGLPVIASDVGGIRSLVQHGHNGLLVKPADVRKLSSAIIELLKDPQRCGVFGNNARIFIKDNFSQEKMISQTEGVYSECLKI
jgi:glycosyltransferase involved in cell wall biosynthesis